MRHRAKVPVSPCNSNIRPKFLIRRAQACVERRVKDDTLRAVARMAPDDAAKMVDFAHRWMRFGGGPDEAILFEFGLTPSQFFRRLHNILHSAPPPHLDAAAVTALLQVCRQRLWSTE